MTTTDHRRSPDDGPDPDDAGGSTPAAPSGGQAQPITAGVQWFHRPGPSVAEHPVPATTGALVVPSLPDRTATRATGRQTRLDAPTESTWTWWLAVPGVLGVALAAIAIVGADTADIGQYGLIEAVGPLHLLGAALVVLGALLHVGAATESPTPAQRFRHRVAGLHVAALILLLHGLPGFVEPHPRFGVAWLHSGFIEHIATDGTLLPTHDARFSWPGFFSGNALLQTLSDTGDMLWMVRFAPVVVSAFACLCIGLIGRALGRSRSEQLVATVVYLVANWSGQDYFAPQALAFCFYLALVSVLLTMFPAGGPAPGTRLARLLRSEPAVPGLVESSMSVAAPARLAALGACTLVAGVIVVTHQLTPGFLASALVLLSLTGVVRIRTLPWVIGIGTVVWLSYGAEAYWLGHLTKLTGAVGDTSALVGDNVGNRAAGAAASRQVVLAARIGLGLGVWGLAGLLVAHGWFRRRTPIALGCLVVAPFPLFLLQPYGGEMLIRVFFFTLPAASLLIAGPVCRMARSTTRRRAERGHVPTRRGLPVGRGLGYLRREYRRVGAGLALGALLPVFMLARFGNEEYESFSDEDVALIDALTDAAPDGSVVYVANRQTLLDTERVGDVRYRSLDSTDIEAIIDEVTGETGALDAVPGASDGQVPRKQVYVMLSRTQEAYWEQTRGFPDGWISELAGDLFATGAFVVDYHDGSSWVLRLVRSDPPAPEAGS